MAYQYIRLFSELSIDDVDTVGGKNASLGKMYCALSPQGVTVPNGFATTAEAHWYFLHHNQLEKPITDALTALDIDDRH